MREWNKFLGWKYKIKGPKHDYSQDNVKFLFLCYCVSYCSQLLPIGHSHSEGGTAAVGKGPPAAALDSPSRTDKVVAREEGKGWRKEGRRESSKNIRGQVLKL